MAKLIANNDIRLALATRAEQDIDNIYSLKACSAGDRLACREEAKKYPASIPRPVGPTNAFNCHGLTFAARRTQIPNSASVAQIIKEDGYRELAPPEILPGDIAVYWKDGEIAHSGVVMYIVNGVTWVLSKWGQLHEAIHRTLDCPYSNCNVVFYRLDS